ncbi:hypothetical protein, partial [Escherichia coli]|uniref:hypothetical protein n=1 Tax=Escherichia coli TaxID=562 RepID=UPI0013039E50
AMAQRCSGVAPPAPLFSAILNYRHSRKREPEAVLDSPLHAVEWLGAEERTNYPLMLAVDDDGDALRLTAQTAAAVTPHRICAMMQQCLDQLVSALETDPHMPVCRVDVIPAGDRAQLLEAWNATAKALDRPC